MQAIQITVRDMPHSLALESEIRKKADKLNQFYHHINSCHVTVQIPQKHKHQGKLYSVHIDLGVPGNTLVVNHKIDENVHIAIRDAFRAAQRQLSSYSHKRRGDVKVRSKNYFSTKVMVLSKVLMAMNIFGMKII
jgi:ribosomal subunit interface protein